MLYSKSARLVESILKIFDEYLSIWVTFFGPMGQHKRKSNRKLRFTASILEEITQKINSGESKRSLAKQYGISKYGQRKRLKAGTVPESPGGYKFVFTKQILRSKQDKLMLYFIDWPTKICKQLYIGTLK